MSNNISPSDILTFWRDAGYDRWYGKDAAFDEDIRTRFLGVWESARDGKLGAWQDTDEGALALVIVLDQFSRNVFATIRARLDRSAGARCRAEAVEEGRDMRAEPKLRPFLYLPFEHSEAMHDQERCVELFRKKGDADGLKWAELMRTSSASSAALLIATMFWAAPPRPKKLHFSVTAGLRGDLPLPVNGERVGVGAKLHNPAKKPLTRIAIARRRRA